MNGRNGRPSGPSRNMVHVPVMAGGAIPGDARVSKNRGFECRDCVTNITILARWQMACRPNSVRIVGDKATGMAAFATAANTWMYSGQEGRRCKTAAMRIRVA